MLTVKHTRVNNFPKLITFVSKLLREIVFFRLLGRNIFVVGTLPASLLVFCLSQLLKHQSSICTKIFWKGFSIPADRKAFYAQFENWIWYRTRCCPPWTSNCSLRKIVAICGAVNWRMNFIELSQLSIACVCDWNFRLWFIQVIGIFQSVNISNWIIGHTVE